MGALQPRPRPQLEAPHEASVARHRDDGSALEQETLVVGADEPRAEKRAPLNEGAGVVQDDRRLLLRVRDTETVATCHLSGQLVEVGPKEHVPDEQRGGD